MFGLNTLQIALFIKNLNLENKNKVASTIIDINDVFDGDQVMLPLPPNAPPELPRIIIKSKNEIYSCNVGLNRLDLIFNPKSKNEQGFDFAHSKYPDVLLNLAGSMIKNHNMQIHRIGLIFNLSEKLDNSSNDFINQKYLKDDVPISGTYDLQIHALNKVKLANEIEANRWLRILSARDQLRPDDDKLLVVSIDINSIPDIEYIFDTELIKKTFYSAIENIKDLMKQHYGDNWIC